MSTPPHPHAPTPADLPPGEDWTHGCPLWERPVQGDTKELIAL